MHTIPRRNMAGIQITRFIFHLSLHRLVSARRNGAPGSTWLVRLASFMALALAKVGLKS
jgi:hypothetical protein